MKQQKLQENTIKKQEIYIQEMQKTIALLEEENGLQKELLRHLGEENEILRRHVDDYARTMRQMLEEMRQQETERE